MYLGLLALLLVTTFSIITCAPVTDLEIKRYLEKYGYTNGMKEDEMTKEDMKDSLKKFQMHFNITGTGEINDETNEIMNRPRCGIPDIKFANAARSIFKTKKVRSWGPKTHLTYKLNNYPRNGLTQKTARKEIEAAFNLWSEHTSLTFENKKTGSVDIDIYFNPANEGDGPGKTLAYAYYPKIGDAYFDAENWTPRVKPRQGINLFLVAAHEFGHSLGLSHSEFKNALMYPYINDYDSNFQLHFDDIRRIQKLYGKQNQVKTSFCNRGKIDAAFAIPENIVYIIKDDNCWKYKDKVLQEGYPKLLSEEWQSESLLPTPLEAAYEYKNDIYFFEAGTAWVYNNGAMHIFQDSTNQGWNSALIIGDRLYLFKGRQYWRYLKKGFPRLISSFWKGVPSSIDAAYYDSDSDRFVYFFKNEDVYRFDLHNPNKDAVHLELSNWFGCKNFDKV